MSCIITSKSLKIISKIIENNFKNDILLCRSTMIFCCVSLTNVRPSRGVCQHFQSTIQVLLLYISRPSTRQWSLISFSLHRGLLRGNSHRSLHIEALCVAMIIDLFTSRPSTRQWSLLSLHRGPLRGNSCVSTIYESFLPWE